MDGRSTMKTTKSGPSMLGWFAGLLAAVLGAPHLPAHGARTYDLLPGSFLRNDCPVCDRPSIEEPLAGTFLLSPSAATAGSYDLTAIDLRTTGTNPYTVKGQGTYVLASNKEPSQDLTLALTIN